MFANILIAAGFFGTGILAGLMLAALAIMKGDKKKSEYNNIYLWRLKVG